LVGRPDDRGVTIDEHAVEVVCCVAQSSEGALALPAHVEGDNRIDGWDRRIECADGIQNIAEVREGEIIHPHRRRAGAEIRLDTFGWDRDSPEEPAGGDSWINIGNLLVELTSKEVESDEAERAVAGTAILGDVEAVHVPHVGVEGERGCLEGRGVR